MRKLTRLHRIWALVLCLCLVMGSTLTVEAATAKKKSSSKPKLTAITFDADYYYNTYPDLQQNIGYDYSKLYNHYITYGLKEGRFGSAEFNCLIYMNNYADLQAAFGNKYSSYCTHHEKYGQAEARNASSDMVGATTLTEAMTAVVVNATAATDAAAQAVVQQGTTQVVAAAPAAQIEGTVIGTYSTLYDAGIARATNVNLAASRINGVVVQPGAEFSFSQTILPRTRENGYVSANVISGGRYTKGTGGGVCQVSSTLYAAMLAAGLPATERYPHSLPVTYMPVGMDATISGTSKDLKFVNTFDTAIQIQATTGDNSGTLTVSLIKL